MLVTSLGMAAVALIAFIVVIFVLGFTKVGRTKARDLILKQKQNLIWNGLIMATFVNYLNISIKARDMLMSEEIEK